MRWSFTLKNTPVGFHHCYNTRIFKEFLKNAFFNKEKVASTGKIGKDC